MQVTYSVRMKSYSPDPAAKGMQVAVFTNYTEASQFIADDFAKNGETDLYVSQEA